MACVLLSQSGCQGPVDVPYASSPDSFGLEKSAERICSSNRDAELQVLKKLPVREVFKKLQDAEFQIDEDLRRQATLISLGDRKSEAIKVAVEYVKLPVTEIVDGKLVNRYDDFELAKEILQVFPGESVTILLRLYEDGDAITKGNVIRVAGHMAGDGVIKMLIRDLEDKTICKESHPEAAGEPLRICDLAYNQLVLRYNFEGLLRTIGTSHNIEVRDYHIGVLRGRL